MDNKQDALKGRCVIFRNIPKRADVFVYEHTHKGRCVLLGNTHKGRCALLGIYTEDQVCSFRNIHKRADTYF